MSAAQGINYPVVCVWADGIKLKLRAYFGLDFEMRFAKFSHSKLITNFPNGATKTCIQSLTLKLS